ncbi:hypothetical protein I7I53_01552 [Histoplasma capsulatum var. duboisii H88]|uniref:Uncharacterized protein n=1 Tax=Ajellomyces capsulatus (strain H88) TaxID=544711 RepID=A0A8A1LM08_AJEC8|nr:hypothetical protein I7I53_01552 [Histoplasma capsulatum var. duboisii H88]
MKGLLTTAPEELHGSASTPGIEKFQAPRTDLSEGPVLAKEHKRILNNAQKYSLIKRWECKSETNWAAT